MHADYVVVGSGLTGATIARLLVDARREVLVIERRPHLGGNLFDFVHPSGIPIHAYGPHYFFAHSDEIWAFVNRFAHFYRHETISKSLVDGHFENWPIAAGYIKRTVGDDWQPSFRGTPANFEEAVLKTIPRSVYEKFVKGYTEKQWGVPARMLSAGLAERFVVREDSSPQLKQHKYQGLPENGYTDFMHKLLKGIPITLNFDSFIIVTSLRRERC